MLLRPSTSLRLPYRLVIRRFSSKRLMAWSSYFQSQSPIHRRDLLMVKTEQKKVPYRGRSCVLLMQPWQGGRLACFPLLGFEKSWPVGCLPFSSLAPVLLYPFAFTFLIPVCLVCDDLGVAMNNHTYGPYHFSEI